MALGSESARKSDIVEALQAAGEIGRDLMAVDWRQTPLGPPDEWPLSLQTIVRVVLSSRFSMWLAWGPELTFFCNESYRSDTLGKKYPWALGQPARAVWSEIWSELSPRIERVLRTGRATWDESLLLLLERSGFEEETYHTFSYSPLVDEHGATMGVLCVVSEETQRVIGERRIATLRDLGSVRTAVEDEHAFLRAAAGQLARNPRSLPFTAVYLFDAQGNAHLAATSGLRAGDPAAPETIAAEAHGQEWPARRLASGEGGQIEIGDLQRRFGSLPTGAWERPPTRALAMALPHTAGELPRGFLVVGVNRYRPLDQDYRSFVWLIAQRLAAGVAGASSYAAERERAEQLAELDRAKTAFFSNISHEFRTPLTLMLAPVQDALDGRRPLEVDQVELVQRNGLRLLKLVNTLLNFSKLEAGRLQAEFHPLDVAALTAELAGTFRDACRRAGIDLVVETEAPRQTAYVDPDLWERVVLNLVSNAFKVTLSGQITVRLHGEGDDGEDGALLLSVADTGPGIEARERERIFDRFHRIRNLSARSHEGTGIGLALVREIVELHGGQVQVDSAVGRGSVFSVRVPLGRSHLPAEHVSEEPVQAAPGIADLFTQEALSWLPSAAGGGGAEAAPEVRAAAGRVLIADDNPDLRRYLTRLLSPFWEVRAVGDGAEALAAIREDAPDLLISDVMMPGMDGLELLRELRSSTDTQQLPVIMLSARAGEEAAIEGLQAGADDYLPKPFSGRELLARVRSHLELSLVRRQASEQVRAERLLLEQTVEQMPAGVVLAEAPSGRIVMANQQLAAIFGHPPAPAGRVGEYSEDPLYLPDRRTRAGSDAPLARAVRDGVLVEGEEMAYRTDDGRWLTLRVSAAPVLGPEGRIVAGVGIVQDVTDDARAERLLTAQRDLMEMIARGEPVQDTLTAIVESIERLSNRGGLASILLVDADERHLTGIVAPSLPAEYSCAIDGLEISEGAGSCGTAAYRRAPVVVPDIAADPLWDRFHELAAVHRLGACWSTPIFARGGRLVGTCTVYYDHPTNPSPEDRQVVELFSRTAAVAIERARDAEARSRQLSELQTSLLPPRLPTVDGLEAAAAFHPGDRTLEVGGDFYDLFALGDGAWGLVVGDVCGHGAQAAAVTALTRHSTWAYGRLRSDPAQVLTDVSDALLARGYERHCTAVYGCLRPAGADFRVTLAVGGHPPPLIRRAAGAVEWVSAHGPLLGVIPGPSFPVNEVTLNPGDLLVLYTDGLIERNPRLADESALAELVASLADNSAAAALSRLESAALGPPPRRPSDDVAILIIRVSERTVASEP